MRKRTHFKVKALAAALASAAVIPMSGHAYETQVGEINVQIDTTLSVGFGWRASDIDYEGVGRENAIAAGQDVDFNEDSAKVTGAHLHGTGSQDNSNLRYEKGETFSEIVKGSVDIDLTYQDFGAFIRGRFWYDNRLEKGHGGNTLPEYYATDDGGNPLEPNPKLGRGGEILDAFIWGDWYINDMPLNMRLGKQVISWGEGVFFPNGINTINPIDVNALLAPGSELKEALIPVKAFYASLGLNENLSLEFFYQFEWEETRLPGCGTFYSTTDLVGYQGCDDGFYLLGGDAGSDVGLLGGAAFVEAEDFLLPRDPDDIEGDDDGQFGFAARYFIEDLEMEVAAYYIRYNSRLPLLSGYTPSLPEGDTAFDVRFGTPDAAPNNTLFTLPSSITDLQGAYNQLTGPNFLGAAFLLPYSRYVVDYPDKIELFGVSMNTTLDFGLPGGATSVSAELSMRKNQPFQIEDGVLVAGLVGFPSQLCEDAPQEYNCYSTFDEDEYVPGYIREDYFQGEIAFIHFFDQILGANRWTTILDIGFSYADIPSKSKLLMNSSYNAALATPWFPETDWFATDFSDQDVSAGLGIAFEDEYYPDKSAWGYKLRFSGEYNDVFAGVNFVPTISFSHDVSGTTPSPITNFLEDRMSIGLSGEFVYQNMYSVKLGYTDFFGAEPYNQLADRDSYTLSASVSF
ncbi:MAG: DUF1302 domain-containing protein [Pseudomonadales bacterium]|nr:DUF1302 domain-containing protein [Pseudomonadales bacterium]